MEGNLKAIMEVVEVDGAWRQAKLAKKQQRRREREDREKGDVEHAVKRRKASKDDDKKALVGVKKCNIQHR